MIGYVVRDAQKNVCAFAGNLVWRNEQYAKTRAKFIGGDVVMVTVSVAGCGMQRFDEGEDPECPTN